MSKFLAQDLFSETAQKKDVNFVRNKDNSYCRKDINHVMNTKANDRNSS